MDIFFVRAEVVIPHINITFNVDMSNVEDVSADGVYVGGGTFFGDTDDNLLTDAGNGIYTTTMVPANSSSNYTYLNGTCPGNWSCKEQIADKFVQMLVTITIVSLSGGR